MEFAVHIPFVELLGFELVLDQVRRVEAERDAMERRIAGLRGERIDRDQLDERARMLLNLVGKDELVIPYESGKRLF